MTESAQEAEQTRASILDAARQRFQTFGYGKTTMAEIADGLILYAVFLFSTTLHEAAHAWAALKGGDPTAHHGGQVTLAPWPHIRREPFGMVILPLITTAASGWPLGYASVPFDPRWAMLHQL